MLAELETLGIVSLRDNLNAECPSKRTKDWKAGADRSCAGFSSLVASTAALIATGWSEPVPGRIYLRCPLGPAAREIS
jgi:hypothetical protein